MNNLLNSIQIIYLIQSIDPNMVPIEGSTINIIETPQENSYRNIVYKILERMNVNQVKQTFDDLSAEASQLYPSSVYTQAVQDVQQGKFDIAVGDFWVTNVRTAMTPMVYPIYTDIIHLYAKGSKSSTFKFSNIQQILEEQSLYALILVILLFTIFQCIQERSYSVEFEKKATSSLFNQLITSLTIVVNSWFKGRVSASPSTIPGKILSFGLAFATFITFAFFLSSLSATLMVAQMGAECLDLNCIIKNRKKVFVSSVIYDVVVKLYPELYLQNLIHESASQERQSKFKLTTQNTWEMDNYQQNLALAKGDIHAYIQVQNQFTLVDTANFDFHKRMKEDGYDLDQCEFLQPEKSQSLLSIQLGFPVNETFQHKFSAVLYEMIEDGTVNTMIEQGNRQQSSTVELKVGRQTCISNDLEFNQNPIPVESIQWVMIFMGILIGISIVQQLIIGTKEPEQDFFKGNTMMDNFSNMSYLPNLTGNNEDGDEEHIKDRLRKFTKKITVNMNDLVQDQYDEPKLEQDQIQDLQLFKVNYQDHIFHLMTQYPEYFELKIEQNKNVQNNQLRSELHALEVYIENAGNEFDISEESFINHFKMSIHSYNLFKNFQQNQYKAISEYKKLGNKTLENKKMRKSSIFE